MTPGTEAKLKGFADYFGLPLVYSSDLPDSVPGMLVPVGDSAAIVVNAKRPPLDHAFTIAHEIGHYIMHQNGKPKFPSPWFLNRQWKWKWARLIARKARVVRCEKYGTEWEADFWAFVMLWHLAALTELQFVFDTYPEKRSLYWLSILGVILGASRRLEKHLPLSPTGAIELLRSALSSRRSRDDR